jgi:hypothetical protein
MYNKIRIEITCWYNGCAAFAALTNRWGFNNTLILALIFIFIFGIGDHINCKNF